MSMKLFSKHKWISKNRRVVFKLVPCVLVFVDHFEYVLYSNLDFNLHRIKEWKQQMSWSLIRGYDNDLASNELKPDPRLWQWFSDCLISLFQQEIKSKQWKWKWMLFPFHFVTFSFSSLCVYSLSLFRVSRSIRFVRHSWSTPWCESELDIRFFD